MLQVALFDPLSAFCLVWQYVCAVASNNITERLAVGRLYDILKATFANGCLSLLRPHFRISQTLERFLLTGKPFDTDISQVDHPAFTFPFFNRRHDNSSKQSRADTLIVSGQLE